MTLTDFIAHLASYHDPARTFNPWGDYDPACDLSPETPAIRRQQLERYLQPRLKKARILLVAEAAGYQGCRFTGIPITCERMLLGAHKQITPAMILGGPGRRTSRPDCRYMTNAPQREKGMNEPTDTYVWGAVLASQLEPQAVLLWNIFPFHPHKASPFSNRTPADDELAAGLVYAKELLSLCQQQLLIGAIGRKAASTLQTAGINASAMRHPANGGANIFREQFARFAQASL